VLPLKSQITQDKKNLVLNYNLHNSQLTIFHKPQLNDFFIQLSVFLVVSVCEKEMHYHYQLVKRDELTMYWVA
jgi:hypothetical protein